MFSVEWGGWIQLGHRGRDEGDRPKGHTISHRSILTLCQQFARERAQNDANILCECACVRAYDGDRDRDRIGTYIDICVWLCSHRRGIIVVWHCIRDLDAESQCRGLYQPTTKKTLPISSVTFANTADPYTWSSMLCVCRVYIHVRVYSRTRDILRKPFCFVYLQWTCGLNM